MLVLTRPIKPKKNLKYFCLIGLMCFCLQAIPQSDSLNLAKEHSVGLVLSGGGAKGFAYVGLLKVLEEVNMPIDYIGGTSIGAIVGGLYSLGYAPETIEELIKKQDWEILINDKQQRQYMAFEEKLFSDRYIFSIPVQDSGFSLSPSIATSFHIDLMLNNLFSPASQVEDFNELPIPFICIATDLFTGEGVVLDSGNLARSIRASMAIPGYFPPTTINGRYFVDGGVINNYPALQVREMGAKYLIGGDVQEGLKSDKKDLNSVTNILNQVVSFNRVEANKTGISITDYYVPIAMSYSMMDFTLCDSIIARGEKVARQHYGELKHIADSLNELRGACQVRKRVQMPDSVQVDQIVWPGLRWQQRERFKGYFDGIHNTVSLSEIEERMLLLNGSKGFDELHYEFKQDSLSNQNLHIFANSLNKGSLSAGIHYDNVYQGGVLVNMALRNINGSSAKFFLDLILSQNPRLNALYINNKGFKPGFGMGADLYTFSFSLYDEGKKVNGYSFDHIAFSAFMPMTIRNDFQLKTGFQYELFRFRQDVIIDTVLEDFSKFIDYGNFFISFTLDNRDKLYFPKRGLYVDLKAKHLMPFSSKWNEFIKNSTVMYFKLNSNHPLGSKVTFKPSIFLGYTFGKQTISLLPTFDEIDGETLEMPSSIPVVHHLFGFGGLNPNNYNENHVSFTGLRFIERFGRYAGMASAKFEYNFYPKLYATVMVDIGFNEMEYQDIGIDRTVLGYGLKLSYESFVGPVELSLMNSSISSTPTAFINVGFWF